DGQHTVTMTATDRFNNTRQGVQVTFTIDTTPPPVPTAPVVMLPNGSVATGSVLTSSTFVVRTVGQTDSLIRLYRNNVEVGNGIAHSPVDFAVNLSLLGDGTYTFKATAEDFTGNVSVASPPRTAPIAPTPPAVTGFDLAPASDTGTPGDHTTDLAVVTLVGHTEPNARLQLLGTGLPATTAAADGSFAFTVSLAYGVNTFTLQATDD